ITLASAASNVSFMAPGSKLEFLASAEFERAFIDILVDGQLIQKAYVLDHKTNTVSINLGESAKNTHLVEIYNRGEGDSFATRLISLETEQTLIPITKPNRKLMFIGASVTCGTLSEPADNCALGPASHNGRVAHGTLIAHALNAESQLVCRSGRGILNGSVASIPQDAVHFLDYILTTANGPVYWDHRLFTPDGILIALGNNDDLSNGERFISAYNTLLYKLRSLYPEALIILTEGPLISGERKNQLTAYLTSIVSASNDAKLSYIPSKKYPNSPCNDHPDAKTHQAIAEELLPQIKEKLKW
ncbi:MAG TPA: hypothetical protein PKE57_08810, partial [Cellvibrionaceae bacterium]|nr:hypothetical protein [Cellvibrionaceae bacterium]